MSLGLGSLSSEDFFSQKWTTAEALVCLRALKTHFCERPMEYARLMSLLRNWWCGTIQSMEMVSQCSSLLRDKPRLLRDINYLIRGSTEEVQIICSVDEPDAKCVVAIYGALGEARTGIIHVLSTSESLPPLHNSNQLEGDGFWDQIHSVEKHWAPFVMELLQVKFEDTRDASLRNNLLKSLKILNRRHGVLPPSIVVHDVSREGENPITGGGFADIWKGNRNGQLVCLKVLRFFPNASNQSKAFKDLSDEVLVWKQLQHPNILSLYGVNMELFQPRYCIVSPWMENGDIGSYLSKSKQSNSQHKLSLVTEIAEGLAYLHELDPPC